MNSGECCAFLAEHPCAFIAPSNLLKINAFERRFYGYLRSAYTSLTSAAPDILLDVAKIRRGRRSAKCSSAILPHLVRFLDIVSSSALDALPRGYSRHSVWITCPNV